MATTTLAAPGYALDPATGAPTGELFPGTIRLLTPFMNITGGFALALGALFSAYVFMPKKRVLAYSPRRDRARRPVPVQPPDLDRRDRRELRRVAAAGDPGPLRRQAPQPGPGDDPDRDRRLPRQRRRRPEPVRRHELLRGRASSSAVLFLFAGFLVSIEAFREIRIPFTSVVLQPGAARAGGRDGPRPRTRRRRRWPPRAVRRTRPADAPAGPRPVPCPGARPEAAARLPDRRRRRERLRPARAAGPVRLRRRLRSAVVRRLAGDVRPALRPRRDLGPGAARRRASWTRGGCRRRTRSGSSRSPRRRSASTSRCSSPST